MKPALVLLAAILGLGILVAPSTATAAGAEVSVSWPEVTRFNPTTTAYAPVVTNHGTGRLFYAFVLDGESGEPWYRMRPLADSEPLTFTAEEQGDGVVALWSCSGDDPTVATCSKVATSPALVVISRIYVVTVAYEEHPRAPGSATVPIYVWPGPAEVGALSGWWEILDATGHALERPARGVLTSDDLAMDGLEVEMPWTIPDRLPSGDYRLDVHVAAESADFGHLESSLSDGFGTLPFRVDTDAPVLTVGSIEQTFYPIKDGYADTLTIPARASEPVTGALTVLDAGGRVVFEDDRVSVSSFGGSGGAGGSLAWDGTTGTPTRGGLPGVVAPAGAYTLELDVADDAGNAATWTGHTVVSGKSLKPTMWKRTFRASDLLMSKYVGKCSKMAKKRHGALGFYSQATCKGSPRASLVSATFGVYLPPAIGGYDSARVTLIGGPATRSPKNYLVFGYEGPTSNSLLNRTDFTKGNHKHAAPRISLKDDYVWDRKAAKPYLQWGAGLVAGSRYDLRKFTVEVRYVDLR